MIQGKDCEHLGSTAEPEPGKTACSAMLNASPPSCAPHLKGRWLGKRSSVINWRVPSLGAFIGQVNICILSENMKNYFHTRDNNLFWSILGQDESPGVHGGEAGQDESSLNEITGGMVGSAKVL